MTALINSRLHSRIYKKKKKKTRGTSQSIKHVRDNESQSLHITDKNTQQKL